MLVALTSREWLLVAVAAVFILFALAVSMLVPRARPDFPGRSLGWFMLATLALFVAMMTAVVVATGGEEHGAAEEHAETETGAATGEDQTTTEAETETEGETDTEAATTGEEEETTTGGESGGDAAAGAEVFASAGCGGCHTLEAAGTSGNVGPNLDELQPSEEQVATIVREGRGAMPSFEGQLDDEQIADVSAYVSENAGG